MLDKTVVFARRNAVALLALFIALSGSAYAANQVGSNQIKDESVRSVDVKDGSIRGGDIASNAVGVEQLKQSAYPVSSAYVGGDEDGVFLLGGDGFSSAQRIGVGQYKLVLSEPNSACRFVATPAGVVGGPLADLASTASDNQSVTIGSFDASGNPVDLGGKAGFISFTVFGAC